MERVGAVEEADRRWKHGDGVGTYDRTRAGGVNPSPATHAGVLKSGRGHLHVLIALLEGPRNAVDEREDLIPD